MKTDAMLEAGVGGPFRRAEGGGRPWVLPIATGVAILTAWMVVVQPFALIDRAVRAGGAATPEMLLLAVVSVAGLAGVAAFILGTGLYLAALHSMGRLR
jgi:hypothetical protein